jgi:hypothetical protein
MKSVYKLDFYVSLIRIWLRRIIEIYISNTYISEYMKKIMLCIFIFLFTGQIIQAQQKVYMPFFEVINIQEDYQYSLSKLFQKYVKDQGKYEILLPEWNNELYPKENNEVTQSKARELGVPFFIKGNLNGLGDLIIVTVSMFQTDNGKEVWNALLKANKLDDLDPILITCSKNLGEKNVTSTANDIYTVTEQEGKELVEVETKISSGLLLGGLYPFGGAFATGLGILTTYDNRNIIYGLDASMFFHEDNQEGHIAITIDYPFTSAKNTGYAGGGLGYGFISIYDEADPNNGDFAKGGLMLMGGGGFILNRTASVRFIFGSRLLVPLFKVNDKIRTGINFYIAVNISKRAKRKQTYDINVNR